jgi:2-polyprenyl-6-methoxyphenol hydroxylase-like FAD-dependent oxidoreductase
MSEENGEVFDVVICGCGPTAALLSANLSRLGVKHVVLEREADITTDPRGIVLDEDGIRCVQGVGKYEELLTEVGTGNSHTKVYYISNLTLTFWKR